jgi:hypothetical protein
MTTTMDNEWAEMVRDWQSNDRPPPNLARRVKRGTWAHYGGVALVAPIVAMFLAMPVGAYLRQPSRADVYIYGAIAAFGLAIAFVTLRDIVRTVHPEANTTRAYLELSRRRLDNVGRAMRTIRIACVGILAFGAMLAPWRLYQASVAHDAWAPIGWAMVRIVVGVAFLGIPTLFGRRRLAARMAAVDEVLAELQ